MKDRYTIKKYYRKTVYKDFWLWGHIQIRVRERVNEFWKYFLERLSFDENKLLEVNSFNELVFDFECLIIKQVYAMATYDGLYSKGKDKEKIDLMQEDEKLDNLIEICFDYPELFISMLFIDKGKVVDLLKDQVRELKQITSPEGKRILEFYVKAKTSEDKEEFEQIIKAAKENLIGKRIKPVQTAVSEFLNIPNSTFREKLERLKINFSKI